MALPLIVLVAAAAVADIPMPVCAGAEDCELKWGRAVHWVLDHNPEIADRTADLIRTGPPQVAGANYYQVMRIPEGDGRYTIDLRVGCANDLWGCKWKALKRDFAAAVSSPAP